jgi:hypothetical protein
MIFSILLFLVVLMTMMLVVIYTSVRALARIVFGSTGRASSISWPPYAVYLQYPGEMNLYSHVNRDHIRVSC